MEGLTYLYIAPINCIILHNLLSTKPLYLLYLENWKFKPTYHLEWCFYICLLFAPKSAWPCRGCSFRNKLKMSHTPQEYI